MARARGLCVCGQGVGVVRICGPFPTVVALLPGHTLRHPLQAAGLDHLEVIGVENEPYDLVPVHGEAEVRSGVGRGLGW